MVLYFFQPSQPQLVWIKLCRHDYSWKFSCLSGGLINLTLTSQQGLLWQCLWGWISWRLRPTEPVVFFIKPCKNITWSSLFPMVILRCCFCQDSKCEVQNKDRTHPGTLQCYCLQGTPEIQWYKNSKIDSCGQCKICLRFISICIWCGIVGSLSREQVKQQ